VSSNPAKKTITASHQSIFDLLKRRTGMIFPETRQAEISDMMEKLAVNTGISLAEYAARLLYDQSVFDDLCGSVTIPETYFFREPRQFEFVKNHVIPAWKSLRLQNDQGEQFGLFHVWSAGCSSGEEAYSLAILLAGEGLDTKARVTATDISKNALALATKAEYGPWALRSSDEVFCQRYFDKLDGRFKLQSQYAAAVRFAHLNLLDNIEHFKSIGLSDLDLIFCRNVLIYFEPAAIAKVIALFHGLLKPGGYLVLGPSDPGANQYADFATVMNDFGVFFQKKESGSASGGTSSTTEEAAKMPSALAPPVVPSSDSIAGQLAKPLAHHRKHQPQANKVPPPKPVSSDELLRQAQTAYTHGLYEKAFNITGKILDDPLAATLHIRALANFSGSGPAEKVLKRLLKQHLSSFQLQYLHGHLLMDLGQSEAALEALKRCLFLDSRATMAHYSLALVQKKLQDRAGAERSFRNVIDLCKNLPADQVLPYGDGERARMLAVQATAELEALSKQQ
jgi:chemotaxis protein methyltransferase CheR